MRYGLSILLIAVFLGIIAFGFLGMDGGLGHMNCIAVAVQGKECPEAPGTAGFINFHLNAAKFFSTAVFGASVSAISLAFLMFAFGISILSHLRVLPLIAEYRLPQFLLSPAALPKEAINSWLSLHEKRDPSLFF